MNSEEILEKAIDKAKVAGWNDVFYDLSARAILFDDMYMGFIFNHDFVKALWGSKTFDAYNEGGEAASPFVCNDIYTCCLHTLPLWKLKLQEMVASEDPIMYLGNNI